MPCSDTEVTAGMIRPLVASADPIAKFGLVGNRLPSAAPRPGESLGQKLERSDDDPTTASATTSSASPDSTVGVRQFGKPDDDDERAQ